MPRKIARRLCLLLLGVVPMISPAADPFYESSGGETPPPPASELRWWKGNLHTHTLWSDGEEYPEMIVDWYKRNGYQFLALSDHNVFAESENFWIELARRPAAAHHFPGYLARFGKDWVETDAADDASTFSRVRLKPLHEFRALFEEPGRFLLINSEEITDRSGTGKSVHMNAHNLNEVIPPQGGATVRETIQNNLNAVKSQSERTGRDILPHLNHPNWEWGVTAEDLAYVTDERFFEVFNGVLGVHNEGDELHADTDRIWDIINTIRIAELNAPPIFGLAVDDAHHYHDTAFHNHLPGRGWIFVRSRYLTPEHIIRALRAGDFYASSGVTLRDFQFDGETYQLEIEPEEGVTYVTEFFGTRQGFDPASEPVFDAAGVELTHRYSPDVGEVLQRSEGTRASYRLTGDELYVRARVTASVPIKYPYSDPPAPRRAWTQPVQPPARPAN
ncbi:MAG TPA: hypothetical protein PLS90_06490 [Candidatus Sumerlaeota bacterium]|nr:hypothetical protein [Candidatus Sumerlaeota bacterium]HPK02088.1 hypothetical protein [Candidatus Sumerlaeota bacterium]